MTILRLTFRESGHFFIGKQNRIVVEEHRAIKIQKTTSHVEGRVHGDSPGATDILPLLLIQVQSSSTGFTAGGSERFFRGSVSARGHCWMFIPTSNSPDQLTDTLKALVLTHAV